MRLDKYLKVSRLIKRRTVANEACDGERVSVNGRQVKASYQVKVGDVIEIAFGNRERDGEQGRGPRALPRIGKMTDPDARFSAGDRHYALPERQIMHMQA